MSNEGKKFSYSRELKLINTKEENDHKLNFLDKLTDLIVKAQKK